MAKSSKSHRKSQHKKPQMSKEENHHFNLESPQRHLIGMGVRGKEDSREKRNVGCEWNPADIRIWGPRCRKKIKGEEESTRKWREVSTNKRGPNEEEEKPGKINMKSETEKKSRSTKCQSREPPSVSQPVPDSKHLLCYFNGENRDFHCFLAISCKIITEFSLVL